MKLNDILYFITLEDITNCRQDMNAVVYNFSLPIERRMEMFKKEMKRITKYEFTEEELNHIAKDYHPARARELIAYIRSIIYSHHE